MRTSGLSGWLRACLAAGVSGWLALSSLSPAAAAEWLSDPADVFDDLGDHGPGDLATRETLLGDLGGARPALAESGITSKLTTTQFYQGVAHGGRQEAFEYGGRGDFILNADGQKLGLTPGSFLEMHVETRYGDAVNNLTGALIPSNTALLFPVPGEDQTALTGLKLTQALSEQFILFGGKINVVDGYMHPFAAGKGQTQFMNTSFVLPPILGRTVPYSSLGAGFAILDGMEPLFSMMVVDPVNRPTTDGFDELFANGVSIFGEFNLPINVAGRPGHQQLYFSWSNREVRSLDANAYITTPNGFIPLLGLKSSSYSLVYAFDQHLFVDPANPQRGWGVFGQLGISDGNPNPIRWSATFGVGGASPLRCRPLDTFGAGVYYLQTSSDLQTTLAPFIPLGNEKGVELYYNAGVTKWLQVTPNLQVVEPGPQNPNTDVVVGLRTHVVF